MTADVFVRYVVMPALGASALFAIVITLREYWREWKRGEW